ncbi:MAG: hypothetical protein HDQ88_11695 [Clostridia bacterium]|nr:hypothetical protein [Clostridia bacterium]
MVDTYICSEYNEVLPLADELPRFVFNDAYPTYLPLFCNGTYEVQTIGYDMHEYYKKIYRAYDYLIAQTNDKFVNPYSSICINDTVYAFKLVRVRDQTPPASWYEEFGVCYYVQTRSNYKDIDPDYSFSYANGTFMRLPSSALTGIVGNPFNSITPIGGEGVHFLYSLGQNLVNFAVDVQDILTYDIAGTNLVTVLFGGGFMLYVAWVVVKWVIPI